MMIIKKRYRTGLLGLILLISMVSNCQTKPNVIVDKTDDQDKKNLTERLIQLEPDELNVLMSYHGKLKGGITHNPIDYQCAPDGKNRQVYGFTSSNDKISWTVEAPEAADYLVAVRYSGKMYLSEDAQSVSPVGIKTWDPECWIEVSCNKSSLSDELQRMTLYNEPSKMAGTKQWLEGTLPLKKGINHITLNFPILSDHQVEAAKKELEEGALKKSTTSLSIKSIELVRPQVWKTMKKRANDFKSDTQWMVDGKYGLFIHWSLLTYPLYGDRQAYETFEWGVNTFDVEAFAKMVEETGASWVIFTTCHGRQMFPAPIKALNNLMPARTTKRDLIAELADALNKRDIKLMLYYNFSLGDEEFAKAVGVWDNDYDKWFKYLIDFTKEVSTRYGKKLAGWGYIDSTVPGYEYGLDWEAYSRAMKSGNPEAIVGISDHWWGPFTPFSDLQTSDAGGLIIAPLNSALYQEGRRFEGMQQHFSFVLDGSWIPREPYNGVIRRDAKARGGPTLSDEEYLDYFKMMDKADVPITINIMITQDVTDKQPFVNPKSLELLKKIKIELGK
jgi:hypothetical protein